MSLKILEGNDLPHELLLISRQETKLRNAFNNNMATDIKLSKAQIFKTIKPGWFLGSLLSKLEGSLIKVAVPLAQNILAPLGITAAAWAIDAGIQKNNTWFWKNNFNNLKQINEWHNENSSSSWRFWYFLKGVRKAIKYEAKEQKRTFRNAMRCFRSRFVRKHISRKRNCKWLWKQKRKRNCKSWLWKRMGFLMLLHSLTNFEIRK